MGNFLAAWYGRDIIRRQEAGVAALCVNSCGDSWGCSFSRVMSTVPQLQIMFLSVLLVYDLINRTFFHWTVAFGWFADNWILFVAQTFIPGITADGDTCTIPEHRRPCNECADVWFNVAFYGAYYIHVWHLLDEWQQTPQKERTEWPSQVPRYDHVGPSNFALRVFGLLALAMTCSISIWYTKLYTAVNVALASVIGFLNGALFSEIFWWLATLHFATHRMQRMLGVLGLDGAKVHTSGR